MNRNHQMEREEIKLGCINEEGKPNTGGRSTSNGTSTTNKEEKRNHDDDMEERITEVETWETKLWKETPKRRDLGLGG